MSRGIKLLITALFLVLILVPAVYVSLTWSVPGDALLFRYTGTRVLPASSKEPASMGSTPDMLVAIDFEVENTHDIDIHLWEAHLLPKEPSSSVPVNPTMLLFTMAGASSTYLGRLQPGTSDTETHLDFPFVELSPVPAHGVRRYSIVLSKDASMAFDPAKAHVLYQWRTATQHRADKWIWWCRSFLPEKFRDRLKGLGYTMDITPITTSP
jgi:hypothetical protein